MIPPHQFALTRSEERWIVEGGEPRLAELRTEAGISSFRMNGGIATLDARSTAFFPSATGVGGEGDRIFATVLDVLPPARRFAVRRLVISRSVGANGGTATERVERLVAIRGEGGGILLPLDGRAADVLLEVVDLLGPPPPDAKRAAWRELPTLWLGGTAAVLFHEAIGHPAEAEASPIAWPGWLRVTDDPRHDGSGAMEIDDAGLRCAPADLTAGERPRARRREGYRDVPLPRMTNLVVAGERAIGALPVPRIEIRMLGGGRWDPRTDVVEVRVVAARRIEAGRAVPLAPFTWRASRSAIPALLAGASGEVRPFPGVLCSNEGQRIAVGSFAPDLLTLPPREGG